MSGTEDTPARADAAEPAPSTPSPSRPRWRRRLGWALAGLLILVTLAVLPPWWAIGTPGGTAWLLGRLPSLKVAAPNGSLLGDFSAEQVEIALPGGSGKNRLLIRGLRWQGLSITRTVAGIGPLRLRIAKLHADRVDVLTVPDESATPATPPASLAIPLQIDLPTVTVGELHAAELGEQALRDVQAALVLGADGGRSHRVASLSLGWDRLGARASGRIASAAPFALEAEVAVTSPGAADTATATSAAPPFDAAIKLDGTLERLDVAATLHGAPPSGRPGTAAPSLELTARVLPFAAWPLAALRAQTQALDLAALHSSAPATALSGSAEVTSESADRPATVALALTNARAGRIDEGLLPVRSLKADLRARPDDPRQVEVRALDVMLGSQREAAGRLQGSGQWSPARATLAATLTEVQPRVLDARAPSTRLGGRIELQADDWLAPRPGILPSVALRGRIDGSLPRNGRSEQLQLQLDVTATTERVELRAARLQAGASLATLSGQALRQGGADWRVKGQGSLADFDPSAWWPGSEGSAWRKGPHRLNATLAADLLLPAHLGNASWTVQRLATSRGQATLKLADSLLAGAPLAGEVTLAGEGAAGLGVTASLNVATASVALRGRLAADARDHWEIDASAADLAALVPLVQLVPSAGAVAASGAFDGQAVADGRWPQLATRGQATLKAARAGGIGIDRATLRWTAATAAQAPLDVQLRIEQLASGAQRLDSLTMTVQGSLADHRISVEAASPVRPPVWLDVLHAAAAGKTTTKERASGTLAVLNAQGGLQFDPAWQQPLRWRGTVQQAELRRRGDGATPTWLRNSAFQVDAQFDPMTATPRLALSPGRLDLPNLALAWTELRWQGGPAPQLALQAQIEPFAVAPLLAGLQPDFGWGGDLIVAGKVNIHSAPSLVAEIEFGRQRGDLYITDEAGRQPLELTDLRLALDVHDGLWNLTQALAGKTLGAAAGAVAVRTDPKALWPPAQAPLEGVMEMRIANLATWGAWVPTGWRLKGMLHASASFGGRFGAPEYTGTIDGSGLGARNLVEGVDVHDGELAITLKGDTARIDKLEARAGEGRLQVSGSAVFGASPQAELRLVADKLLVLGRVDRRVVASGDATLQLKPNSLQLDGRVDIDQGLIDISRGTAPTLGDDVKVVRERAAEAASARPAGPPRDVKIKLALNLGQALRLRGRGLDTRLRGELQLSAPEGRLAINGAVSTAQGTYAAYGQKLDIERGVLTFAGVPDSARLNILAIRPNLDIRVGVAITGLVNAPRIALYSDPDMPDNDKLSWLVLGRASEGGNDTALLQAAAMALLAGEGNGPGSELTRLLQLDTLSMRQSTGVVQDTIVTVGKQVSQRWYVGYERSLNATAGNWQLIYRLAQRFTVRLQTGLDNSIDLIWSWRWD